MGNLRLQDYKYQSPRSLGEVVAVVREKLYETRSAKEKCDGNQIALKGIDWGNQLPCHATTRPQGYGRLLDRNNQRL